MYQEKLPPHDINAEEATLGSLLIDPDAIFKIDTFLRAKDFYQESNEWVYEACTSLVSRSEVLDQVTVARELSQQGKLNAVGGPAYLSRLVSITPTSVNVEHYARIVSRLATMRRMIDAGSRIAAIGYDADPDVDKALAKAEGILFDIHDNRFMRDFQRLGDILGDYFDKTIATKSEGERPNHLKTGFPAIDKILGNLQRSDMIILGARPSLGKSSLALTIARNAAVDQKAGVAVFSLEMSSDQLARRLLSGESGIPSNKIASGELNDAEEKRVMHALGILSDASIYIDDSPHLNADQLLSKSRRLRNEVGIDLIIIDYLQIVYGSDRVQNPIQEMTLVSRSIKALARDLDVPVIALSQLSRAVMSRNKPRIPQLSDLRESGSIEQDADVVMLMYRTDKDYTEEEWNSTHPGERYPLGMTDIEIAKHRNGPTGNVKLYFRDNLTKFNSVELERGSP